MKNLPKILALYSILLVVIFWTLSLPGISLASPQNVNGQRFNNQDDPADKLKKPSNDSLAAIFCDKKPPYFTNLNPSNGQKKVDRFTTIKFTVNDDNVTVNNWDTSGVDTSKIFISIKSRSLNTYSVKPDSIKLLKNEPFELECTYYPRHQFDWSDIVEIKLDAWDLSYFRNHADTIYTFYTIRDTIPPVLTPIYPLPGDQNVPLNSTVIIQGTEIGRGVVLDSIKLWINDSLVSRTIKGDLWNFQIFYDSDSSWDFDHDIHIVCTAYDLDRNADTLDYWINTESPPDTSGPWFLDLIPAPGDTGVPRDTSIKFTVLDDYLGVDVDSVFISMTSRLQSMNKVRVDSFQIIDPCTVRFFYQPPKAFDWNDTVQIKLSAYDLSKPAKPGDTTFIFYTINDKKPPVITAIRPKPDTTNVPINTDIILYVTDESSGVDTASVILKVNDQVIPHNDIDFIISHTGDTIKYVPSLPLAYQSEVKVYFYVADSAANPAYASYSFWTESEDDTFGPIVYDHDPAIYGSIDTLNYSINFKVRDVSGLNVLSMVTTIKINKNGETTFLDSLRRPSVTGDTVEVECKQHHFNYNDTVYVDIYAEDNLGNHTDTTGKDITVHYYFTVLQDTIPPVIEPIDPYSEQDSVSVTTPIVFRVWDNGSGVAVDSIYLDITSDSVNVIHGKPDTFRTVEDTVYFRYRPTNKFAYNDYVTVRIHAADSAKNAADTTYLFWMESESNTLAPIVYDHDPAIYGSIDTLDYSIKFKVRDSSGVNYLSIVTKIIVNGGPPKFLSSERVVSGVGDTVVVKNEQLHFDYNDSVHVEIYAEDNQGNHTDTTGQDSTVYYYFKVLRDATPPIIKMIEPVTKKDVPVRQLVKFEITDSISGVDISTISLNISGEKGYSSTKFDTPQQIDAYTWIITHTPEPEYHEDELITITLSVSDLAGNTTSYVDSFRTVKTLTNLYFISFSSSNGQSPVKEGEDVTLTAIIACEKKDCPDSFSVCFFQNNDKIFIAKVDSMKNGETRSFDTTIVARFGEKDTIMVKAMVDYYNNIEEQTETDNDTLLYLIKDNNKRAKLIVSPNPFTPNDDGINEETVFNFEQFDLEQPSVKIFDIHGRKVRELDQPNNNRFIWNGQDNNGTHLLPGMYLYIFSDKEKALARGCIVIVR